MAEDTGRGMAARHAKIVDVPGGQITKNHVFIILAFSRARAMLGGYRLLNKYLLNNCEDIGRGLSQQWGTINHCAWYLKYLHYVAISPHFIVFPGYSAGFEHTSL